MRVQRRSRPRHRSCDFSRLWWLVATEAAFQIVSYAEGWSISLWQRRQHGFDRPRVLFHLRRRARAFLRGRVVIV